MRNLELGVIGNCAFCALVDERAEMVWTCLPRFDGDPVFCSLLQSEGDSDKGYFGIELADFASSEQRYERNTAILVTTLHDKNGAVLEITDFAPRFKYLGRMFRPTTLIRRIRSLRGLPRITLRLRPSGDYGARTPDTTSGSNHIRYLLPEQVLRLTTNASTTALLDETPFLLEHEIVLILGPDESLARPVEEVAREFHAETSSYWREWVRYLSLPLEWQEAVIRSAITLKLSTFEDTGAVIAAATTSIPESASSQRNWDYRFCWLRDSYFVVNALNRLGATRTMEDYIHYVINIGSVSADNHLCPVYRINGRLDLDERTITSLSGYRGIGPVRVGNDAYRQKQHDVYGAVILAAAQAFFDERLDRPGDMGLYARLEILGEIATKLFDQPDAGLWELRGSNHIHTFSSVMCWVACDRLARIGLRLGLTQRAAHWTQQAERLRNAILSRAWNEKRNSFTATFDGDSLDASLLLIAELGIVPADDPRFAATVQAVEKELKRRDYIFRYVQSDDFGEPQNAFTLCTFWYINALVLLGRRQEARTIFEHMLARRTRLGLLSEHIDPASGELWGNFPQTYSMVGIIHSAMLLSKPWEQAF
ncbi:MAG TPA: glycoside hydrolase family 15 protein [Gammaproteobacteria bacterium]|nr:glycoside hydrolase family 15 protein [Gammaproteobacteria bacterium]